MSSKSPDSLLIYKNDYFRVEQCLSCPIPGYLIMSPRIPVNSFAEMSPAVLSEFGAVLAKVDKALAAVLKPERIFYAVYGEEENLFHVHIFPRTKWITKEYCKQNPKTAETISGPLIFDWVRANYKKDSGIIIRGQGTEEIMEKLRKYLKSF